jgi:hypothetical protein
MCGCKLSVRSFAKAAPDGTDSHDFFVGVEQYGLKGEGKAVEALRFRIQDK